MSTKKYIYESPDGGETVYARLSGEDSTKRWKLPDTPYQSEQTRLHNERILVLGMVKLARSNESLREALDHAIMIYNLIKNEDGSTEHTK